MASSDVLPFFLLAKVWIPKPVGSWGFRHGWINTVVKLQLRFQGGRKWRGLPGEVIPRPRINSCLRSVLLAHVLLPCSFYLSPTTILIYIQLAFKGRVFTASTCAFTKNFFELRVEGSLIISTGGFWLFSCFIFHSLFSALKSCVGLF